MSADRLYAAAASDDADGDAVMDEIVEEGEAVWRRVVNRPTVSGGPVHFTGTTSPPLLTIDTNTYIVIRLNVDAGAGPDINIDGLGSRSLHDEDGNAFASGVLKANRPYLFNPLVAGGAFHLFPGQWATADKTKLNGIETGADVTDAANVQDAIDGSAIKGTLADNDVFAILDSAVLGSPLKRYLGSSLQAKIDAAVSPVASDVVDNTNDIIDLQRYRTIWTLNPTANADPVTFHAEFVDGSPSLHDGMFLLWWPDVDIASSPTLSIAGSSQYYIFRSDGVDHIRAGDILANEINIIRFRNVPTNRFVLVGRRPAVENALVDGVLYRAPSQNAVYDALVSAAATRVDAEANIQTELTTVHALANTNNTDIFDLSRFRTLWQVENVGGTSTAFTADWPSGGPSFNTGLFMIFAPHVDIGDDPTLSIEGSSPKTLLKSDGTNFKAGDIFAGEMVLFRFKTVPGATWTAVGRTPDLVENLLVNGVLNKAPSQNIVFDALAIRDATISDIQAQLTTAQGDVDGHEAEINDLQARRTIWTLEGVGGTSTAFTATMSSGGPLMGSGLLVIFAPTMDTGDNPTLNVTNRTDGGPWPLLKSDGTNIKAGDILDNELAIFRWGTSPTPHWTAVGRTRAVEIRSADSATQIFDHARYRTLWTVENVAGGPVAFTADWPDVGPSFNTGLFMVFAPNVDIGDDPTLAIEGSSPKYLFKSDGSHFKAGDLFAGEMVLFRYTGTPGARWDAVGRTADIIDDVVTNGVFNKAPSSNAVYDAIAVEADNRVSSDSVLNGLIAANTASASSSDTRLFELERRRTIWTLESVGGTSTAFTADMPDVGPVMGSGVIVIFAPNVDCGDNPTLDVVNRTDGGPWPLLKSDGTNIKSGDIQQDELTIFRWGTSPTPHWTAVGRTRNVEIKVADHQNQLFDHARFRTLWTVENVAGSSTAFTADWPVVGPSFNTGLFIIFAPHVDCGNSPTLAIAGGSAQPIFKSDGSHFAAGDILAGEMVLLRYTAPPGGRWDAVGRTADLVEDAVVNGVFNKAPSQNAVYDAIAVEADNRVSSDSVLNGLIAANTASASSADTRLLELEQRRAVWTLENAGGISTAYTAEMPDVGPEIGTGLLVIFAPNVDSGDNPTLDVTNRADGGPWHLLKSDGTNIKAGDIQQDELAIFRWGTSPSPHWTAVGRTRNVEIKVADHQNQLFDHARFRTLWTAENVAGGPVAFTADWPDVGPSFNTGLFMVFTPNVDIGDNPTLSIEGFSPKPLYKSNGARFRAGEILAGEMVILRYTVSPSGRWDAVGRTAGLVGDALSFAQPGDAQDQFYESITAPIPISYDVVVDTEGSAVRISDPGILASGHFFMLENNRIWNVRWAGLRITNSADPEDDAVNCSIAFYNKNKLPLASPDNKVVYKSIAPTAVGGPWGEEATVAFGGGGSIVAPAAARYFKPFIEIFGDTPVTDIRILGAWDVTEVHGQLHFYTLLQAADATGAYQRVAGGHYLWSAAGTFSGATLSLDRLSDDGTTAVSLATKTSATGQTAVDIGEGTEVRVSITGGPPSGITSLLRQVS